MVFVPHTEERVDVCLPSEHVVFESELDVMRQNFPSSNVCKTHTTAEPVLARLLSIDPLSLS